MVSQLLYYANIKAKMKFDSGGEVFFQSLMYYINMVLDHAKKYAFHIIFAVDIIREEVHMDQLTLVSYLYHFLIIHTKKILNLLLYRHLMPLTSYYENEYNKTTHNPKCPYKFLMMLELSLITNLNLRENQSF